MSETDQAERDRKYSGVGALVGVNETGSSMKIRVRSLRRDVTKYNLTHMIPPEKEGGGRSLKEEIRVLEGVLSKAKEMWIIRTELNKTTWPLLLMHTSFAFVTRMWEFAIVLLLAELTNNSLFIVSFSQFLSSFTIFVFSPYTGKWLDETNRLYAIKSILIWKVLTISVAYGLCCILLKCQVQDSDDQNPLCQVPHILYSIPIAAAAAHLAFATTKISLEKDWVVTIARRDKEWLSLINSRMTQIDLTCQSVAPVVTGVLYYVMSYYSVACMLLAINILASACLYLLLKQLYVKCPALAVKVQNSSNEKGHHLSNPSPRNSELSSSPKNLLTSGCAGALISFSCLFLTVLSFGSIMIVYLRWSGVPDYYIGLARGLSALAGFSGALIYPSARQNFGLFRTGIFAIWYQVLFVFVAAFGIYSFSAKTGSVIMIVAVLFSRTGLWLFDLCARQISQETIDENSRGVINGQWASLTSFFDFLSYALTCLFSDPTQFWVLSSASFGMVFVAAAIFSVSYCNTTEIRSRRNSYSVIPDMDDDDDDTMKIDPSWNEI